MLLWWLEEVRGPDIVIAVEVAASTLGYALGLKGRLYSKAGLQEYWIVDAETRVTHLHRGPTEDESWAELRQLRRHEPLTLAALPDFRVLLAEID